MSKTGRSQARGNAMYAPRDVALVVAGGERIEAQAFYEQALALGAALPGNAGLVALCEDRRNFLLLFAAALMRRRTVLLPSSRTLAAVSELRAQYPGCEPIDDTFNPASETTAPRLADDETDFVAAIGHTSGSTGKPVAHTKTFNSFRDTTALNAATIRDELVRQQSAGRPWIVATVPPQHMYGLETSVLLPLLAGFGLHCGKPLMPADVGTALAEVPPPRVLVSTPIHLRALVESSVVFPETTIVLSATAPLPRELANRTEERLGATLIEIFGSTETCVIATRRTARDDGWRPYPGIRLEPRRNGTTVSAPWLVSKQLLHDIIEMRGDGTFTVIGRGTDVVEVAGKRASLADLTRRMQSISGVEDAVVFQPPVQHGGSVGRCAALVVAPGLTAREIALGMRRLVDAAFVPRPIVVVPELPRNEVGKLPRERLLEILATEVSRPRRET